MTISHFIPRERPKPDRILLFAAASGRCGLHCGSPIFNHRIRCDMPLTVPAGSVAVEGIRVSRTNARLALSRFSFEHAYARLVLENAVCYVIITHSHPSL